MSLYIYKEDSVANIVSDTNYIFSYHDGTQGSWHLQKLWLRNDDNLKEYEAVKVDFVINESVNTTGVSLSGNVYQMFKGDIEPTDLEWNSIGYNNYLQFDDISGGDTATFYPFWLRIFVPGNTNAGKIEEAGLRIKAIEKSV